MRIPRTGLQTTWKSSWLIEFAIAFLTLGAITREPAYATVGALVLILLATLGFRFQRKVTLLRASTQMQQRLSRTLCFLGESIQDDVKIRNDSKQLARVQEVRPVLQNHLRFQPASEFNDELQPESESNFTFKLTPLRRGHFQAVGFAVTLTDARRLFVGQLIFQRVETFEVLPGRVPHEELTPLALYGLNAELLLRGQAGTDFAGIREFTSGDEYYRVEWKTTARLSKLMVKEFHPERQTDLRILIDTSGTMRERSYVGMRLDEAIAIAYLLLESVAHQRDRIGIWLYNEAEVTREIHPAPLQQQLTALRELAATTRETHATITHPTPPRTISPTRMLAFKSERGTRFVRLLRLKLASGYRRTGIYKAFEQAGQTGHEGFTVVLTDLNNGTDALSLATALEKEQGGRTIIAQIGAPWRMCDGLEEAYVEYERNHRTLERLEALGRTTVVDVPPERLLERLGEEIGKTKLNEQANVRIRRRLT